MSGAWPLLLLTMSVSKCSSPILLGDSIFRRMFEKYPEKFDPLSAQFCIGGQRVHELKKSVKASRNLLFERRLCLLIGINDLLKGTPYVDIKLQIKSLIKLLAKFGCELTIVEVLPCPKYKLESEFQNLIFDLNRYLRSFVRKEVMVISTVNSFMYNGQIDRGMYCKSMGKGNRQRVDLIHPNKEGLYRLYFVLWNMHFLLLVP